MKGEVTHPLAAPRRMVLGAMATPLRPWEAKAVGGEGGGDDRSVSRLK